MTEHSASPAPKYKIQIDKEHFEIAQPTITGRELLALAKKVPVERYAVYQKKGGQTVSLSLDTVVDLREPGLERFVTLPLDQTEG